MSSMYNIQVNHRKSNPHLHRIQRRMGGIIHRLPPTSEMRKQYEIKV